ncbi:cell division control protein 6 homolog [Trematomus bernacchii]|uniref:cell division control protein 6 homolog n=1 Tax=Trematomus bernacchii TaxID=40690 RepID=UPI00146E2328|nr:cell division control protein 6 homolog [Trematomus bernacchii]
MPSTRSNGQAQPTLAFPRRKSCRVSSHGKTPQREESPAASPSKPETQNLNLGRIAPMSPRRPAVARTSAVSSPLSLRAPPSSPRLQTRLPLSPRKRTGDDNGCNLGGSSLLGSPPKQSKPAVNSPRKLSFDENSPLSVRRRLVPSLSPRKPSSPNTGSSPRRQDTPAGTPEGKHAVARLFAEKSRFLSVKQALHTALPERLLSREVERDAIRCFLRDKALQRVPGSLYISGAPGTGKTACFNCVLQEMEPELSSVQTVLVNCMSLRSSHAIFRLLAEKLKAPGGQGGLQRFLTAPGPAVLLVLDEMDQLDSKSQDVLYTIFEWPYLSQSRLCLVGIANALDLTDRILPRLQARPQCRPLLLHFPPYSRQELSDIVQDRLSQASADGIMDASAVQFCARKVSAVSGDARKALDICRRAVEVVESDERKKSPDQKDEAQVSRVSLPQVARVLSEVYGDRMASQSGGSDGESFPLQQKLLVCCLLLLTRSGKSKEVVLGKLHEVYSRLCSQRRVSAVGQSECLSLCGLLESRGVFALKKAKEARLTKVFLKIEEKDVENALKDRTLLGSILAAGLPS